MKKYKLSMFNITKEIENDLLIFNSLNRGIVLIENRFINDFNNIKLTGTTDNIELLNGLIKQEMVIENSINEINRIKALDKLERYSTDNLSLVIATTFSCNFDCWYCYEKGLNNSFMTENIQNSISDFILSKSKTLNKIKIDWYGGEPLLNIKAIEQISENILSNISKDITFEASIISNGYLLNKEVAKKLAKYHVKKAQITLDGTKKIHDKNRPHINGKGSFDKIIQNIKEINDIINVIVRVNLDKNNVNYFDNLLDYLEEEGLKDKIFIYFSIIKDPNPINEQLCYKTTEVSDLEINLMRKIMKRKFKLATSLLEGNGYCTGMNNNFYIIDPAGDLYKCPMQIGKKEDSIGNIIKGIDFDKNAKWLAYDYFLDSKCKECNLLPLCRGGCPSEKMKNNSNDCFTFKYNIKERLNLFFESLS
ncbi:radical SAM/SPASM domain Clo7bot peptide maturase [Tepiditoga spiralis]|uniref:Radical SAM/SPASM domain Clo7bot peptide maturase n=1 Tax=Tepiditoga spiralis TaxID=2108365 RepID=A0A7G1G223_9BACT|nr:radical SAM protein [Tepiditoga spiralis]BBE29895.1 radical SAM/SPASM domain Clo7bot peptide maturase [Tepiditoga spiralis]